MKRLPLTTVLFSLMLGAPLAAQAAGKRSASMQVSFTIVAACEIGDGATASAAPRVDCPGAPPYQLQAPAKPAASGHNGSGGTASRAADTAVQPASESAPARLPAPADSAALWTVYF